MPKKRKFTEDFAKRWKETTTDEEISKTKRILEKQEELLRKHPKNVNLWFARGELLRSIGEYEKALKCYDAVTKLESDHKAVHNARASVLAALGRREEAVESYQKALQLAKKEEESEEEEEPGLEELEGLIEEVGPPDAEEERPPEKEYFACPMCGELLDPEESRCPTCGTEFLEEIDEEEILERLEALESEVMEKEEKISAEEEAYRKKLEKWRREGYNVLPLEEILQKEPQRARTAFFQFEENLKKVDILRESLRSMPAEGYEEEIEKIELMLRSPYKIWAIEAEMESLWQSIEADQKRREVTPPEREVPPRIRAPEGLINGRRREAFVPSGRINGLINGLESARRGLINGLTNGVGMTNGLGSLRFRREALVSRWKLFLPIIVATVLIISSFFVSVEVVTEGQIRIDGSVDDWEGILITDSRQSTVANPNVDIIETAAHDDRGFLTLYVRVLGTVLQGDGNSLQDTVFAFLDIDRNGGTGYLIEGIGADRMIEVFGSGNEVDQAVMYEFDSARGSSDWSGWFKPRTVHAAADSSYLEVEVSWDIIAGRVIPINILYAAHCFDDTQDMAELVISNIGGSLEVLQESHLDDEIVSGSNENLLQLTVVAHGTNIQLTEITAELVGTALPNELDAVKVLDENLATVGSSTPASIMTFDLDETIQEGVSETLYVAVDTTSASGNTVGVRIKLSSDVRTDNGAVTLKTLSPANGFDLGYLGLVTSGYTIDGAFAEWAGSADNPGDVSNDNPNIDMIEYSAANQTDNMFFFVEVQGRMLKGSALPYHGRVRVEPSQIIDSDRDTVPDNVDGPNGTTVYQFDFDNDGTPDAMEAGDVDSDGSSDYPFGPDLYLNTTIPGDYILPYQNQVVSKYIGPVQKPPATGEDVFRAFIDTQPGVGYLYDPDTGFYADYLLEITGKNCEPLQKRFLSFGGSYPGQWIWDLAGPVEAEKDSAKLEARVDLTGIVVGPAFEVRFYATDWSGGFDSNPGTRYTTRGDFGGYDVISKGDFNAYFTEDPGDVRFEVGNHYLEWTLPETVLSSGPDGVKELATLGSSALQIDQRQASYESVYEEVQGSVRYEFAERTLKEYVVLDSRPTMGDHDDILLEFEIGYSDGLLPFVEGQVIEDKVVTRSLDLYARDGLTFSVFPPIAEDFAGHRTECRYIFSAVTLRLTLTCPGDWLREAYYPVSIDPPVSYTLEEDTYNTSAAQFGRSVAVGDFNGDGYADVVGGAPFNGYNGVSLRGIASIYYGPFTADDNTANVTILGSASLDRLGIAVATGRINNDAYWDVVVSQFSTQPTYVYYGASSWEGEETTPDVTISSQGGGFGEDIAVCDVDNSNNDDVIVGAPGQTGGGRAYIYQSPLSATESSADDVLAPLNNSNGRFGASLSCGTIDNDNFYDVVVGEPEADIMGGSNESGRVSFFKGANIDFSSGDETPDSVLEYRQVSETFGSDVDVGKIDSDSYDDIIVGAEYNDQGGTNNGRAYIYLANSGGSGIMNNSSPDVEIEGQSTGERFGYSVYAGNLMDDSVGDVAIGAPYANESGTSYGAVYVFEDPTSDNSTYDNKTIGGQDNELYGWSLDAGIFSNDDSPVFAAGAPYWDDGGEANEGRVVVTMIPEFPAEALPIAFTLLVPVILIMRRRRYFSE